VPIIEFAYTKYRDMMVPMIPVMMKGGDRWFEFWAFVIQELPILFSPLRRPKPLVWIWERLEGEWL